MNYDEFKEAVVKHLTELFPGEEYEICIRKVSRNNGLILDGLNIFRLGEETSPTIYLEPYFRSYQNGKTLTEVLFTLKQEYEKGMERAPRIQGNGISYETVRSRIVMRVVNYDKNKEILKECPFFHFHDLAVTFRWLAHEDDIGISTAMITDREMEHWGVTKEMLYADAKINTQKLFPGKIMKLQTMMEEQGFLTNKDSFDLYIMTNEQGINGATCILYDSLLQDFARTMDSSFYLLPSSIHEMMLCPQEKQITEKMLLSLVRDANHMVVTMGEILSDNIYFYQKETGTISMIQESKLPF
jgi:hypothetical protein